MSFHDDLLDFDWTQFDGNRVEVVVSHTLPNRLPGKPGWGDYEIVSDPIKVDLRALRAYKQRLREHRDALLKQASKEPTD